MKTSIFNFKLQSIVLLFIPVFIIAIFISCNNVYAAETTIPWKGSGTADTGVFAYGATSQGMKAVDGYIDFSHATIDDDASTGGGVQLLDSSNNFIKTLKGDARYFENSSGTTNSITGFATNKYKIRYYLKDAIRYNDTWVGCVVTLSLKEYRTTLPNQICAFGYKTNNKIGGIKAYSYSKVYVEITGLPKNYNGILTLSDLDTGEGIQISKNNLPNGYKLWVNAYLNGSSQYGVGTGTFLSAVTVKVNGSSKSYKAGATMPSEFVDGTVTRYGYHLKATYNDSNMMTVVGGHETPSDSNDQCNCSDGNYHTIYLPIMTATDKTFIKFYWTPGTAYHGTGIKGTSGAKITYNLNGGKFSDANAVTTDYSLKGITYKIQKYLPTKTGYTFNGYTFHMVGGPDGTADLISPSDVQNRKFSTTISGDVSFNAFWTANQYKNILKYNTNGGSGTFYDQAGYVTYPDTQSKFTVTTTKPTRKGYTFTGWYTAATGGTKVGTTYSFADKKAGDQTVTLYAQWQANTLTIKHNANGGTASSDATTNITTHQKVLSYSTTATYDPVNFSTFGLSKTGYIRKDGAEWNLKSDGTGKSFDQDVGYLYADYADISAGSKTITLYAQWTPISYTIAFNGNGSTSGSMSSMSCKYDTSYTLTANGFAKTGYTFNGWNTKSDGTGTKYTDKQTSIKNLTTTNGGTVTLYAQWTPNSYSIVFNANEGTGTMNAMSCKYDTSYTLTANGFTKTGYTFNGWNTNFDGTGTKYTDKQTSIKNLTTTNGGTITLYAQWKVNTYSNSLLYDINTTDTVTNMPSAQTVNVTYPKTSYTHTVNTVKPVRTGYTFLGWYTDKTNGTKVGATQTVGSDNVTNNQSLTVYAHWQINKYSVTYNIYKYTGVNNNYSFIKEMKVSNVEYNTVINISDESEVYINDLSNETIFIGGKKTFATTSVCPQTFDTTVTITDDTIIDLYYSDILRFTNSLVYNANGGKNAPKEQTQEVIYPNTSCSFTISTDEPVRTGYAFMGWSENINTGIVISSKNITVGANNKKENQSKTLYAVWSYVVPYKTAVVKNEYSVVEIGKGDNPQTVIFHSSGATGTMKPQTVKNGETLNTNSYVYEYETSDNNNYIIITGEFLGWSDNYNDLCIAYNNGDEYYVVDNKESVDLYAIWKVTTVVTDKKTNEIKNISINNICNNL